MQISRLRAVAHPRRSSLLLGILFCIIVTLLLVVLLVKPALT
jgi:hypothetical protein